jgi:hypothetical protein
MNGLFLLMIGQIEHKNDLMKIVKGILIRSLRVFVRF